VSACIVATTKRVVVLLFKLASYKENVLKLYTLGQQPSMHNLWTGRSSQGNKEPGLWRIERAVHVLLLSKKGPELAQMIDTMYRELFLMTRYINIFKNYFIWYNLRNPASTSNI